jgi:uncharacterized protein YmfQ (DUF2313 family)
MSPRPSVPPDRHVRRSGDDYAQALLELLPHGQAWPRDPDSTLVQACLGLADYWGVVDGRAADLLERESDPRYTIELLPDWERAWGLPDPCFPEAQSIGERQRMLVMKMTWMGGQSRAYFQKLMQWLGYGTVTIKEWAPFMAGVSRAGDTRNPNDPSGQYRWYIGPPEQRFCWSIEPGTVGLIWFRAGTGQAGVDHHLEFRVPQEMQCLLNRWKPAQTDLILDFSNLAAGGPMQGTP